jgi:acyl-CoA thioesterase II
MGDLEIDTRLEEVGEGRFQAGLSRDWEIWGPNGGYLAVIALRAVGRVAKVDRPASFAGHFLSVAEFAPIDLEVQTLKAGRRAESFRVSISQAGRAIFEGLVRTAAVGPGLEHDVSQFPDVPLPDTLQSIETLVPDRETPPHPFWSNFDVRPVWPERFSEGEGVSHEPIFREWFRYRPRACFDDPWLEAGRALLMVDTASWPAACQPHPNSGMTAPNLDVTAWFHRSAAESEWLLMDHSCEVAESGLMGTHARIWTEQGKLIATGGAQLFCIPSPAG